MLCVYDATRVCALVVAKHASEFCMRLFDIPHRSKVEEEESGTNVESN